MLLRRTLRHARRDLLGREVDVALEPMARALSMRQAISCLASRRRAVNVGIGREHLSIDTCRQLLGGGAEAPARRGNAPCVFTYGSCQQSATRAATDAGSADAAKAFLHTLPAREFPNLAAMAALQAAGPGHGEQHEFEFGLDLILDGLQRILDENRLH